MVDVDRVHPKWQGETLTLAAVIYGTFVTVVGVIVATYGTVATIVYAVAALLGLCAGLYFKEPVIRATRAYLEWNGRGFRPRGKRGGDPGDNVSFPTTVAAIEPLGPIVDREEWEKEHPS